MRVRSLSIALFGLMLPLAACTTPVPAVMTHAVDATEQAPIALNDVAKRLGLTIIPVEGEIASFYLKDGKGNTIAVDRAYPERYQLNFRSRSVEYPGLKWENDEIWMPIGAYNSICLDLGRADKMHRDGLKVHRPHKDQVSYTPPEVEVKQPTQVTVVQEGVNIEKVPTKALPLKGLTVVVDAGHGGKDPGGIGFGGLREKDIALNVSLLVKKLLEAKGAKVVMTRADDRFLELQERSALANKTGADVFVSIHANMASREYAQGIETWFKAGSKRGELSQSLAKALNDATVGEVKAVDRGARADQRGLHVLRATTMPAALIELGFMSNE
ncbi:MAG: N-acetylmuramoyl-L-alanine amidase, partial [Planctomycetes bacterium]|nr:N-acetylmuramoyl-L-alanine amidase [Planctomycetota bacterium]